MEILVYDILHQPSEFLQCLRDRGYALDAINQSDISVGKRATHAK